MKINRAKTAIHRNKLSNPTLYLVMNEIIKPNQYILDFGCGHGYDVNYLRNVGYDIEGYDPYQLQFDMLPNRDKKPDVLICNYVFNVIESTVERHELLSQLKQLSDTLYITVRADKKSIKKEWAKYGDGYITTRGTFQKFYNDLEVWSLFSPSEFEWEIDIINSNSNSITVRLRKYK